MFALEVGSIGYTLGALVCSFVATKPSQFDLDHPDGIICLTDANVSTAHARAAMDAFVHGHAQSWPAAVGLERRFDSIDA